MNISVKKIAIIGAGVIGTTTAFRLQERFGDQVSITIYSEKISPNTTSDVAAGFWGPTCSILGPYAVSDTPIDKLKKWSKDTHDFFQKLWENNEAAGVSKVGAMEGTTRTQHYDFVWRDLVFNCVDLDASEIERLNKQHNREYKSGIRYTTFTCEPSFLLPYLYERIRNAGGHLELKRIESFDELDAFDLVINCTGLGAQAIVKDDVDLKPVRGQLMRVRAPWITEMFSNDEHYIIPNKSCVILGGTRQENDYNTNVDANDRKFIYDGCLKLIPSLKNAEIIRDNVGLRPGRSQVRLERDVFQTRTGKQLQIIHSYGHGGAGVTLSYGCAVEVADIVEHMFESCEVTQHSFVFWAAQCAKR